MYFVIIYLHAILWNLLKVKNSNITIKFWKVKNRSKIKIKFNMTVSKRKKLLMENIQNIDIFCLNASHICIGFCWTDKCNLNFVFTTSCGDKISISRDVDVIGKFYVYVKSIRWRYWCVILNFVLRGALSFPIRIFLRELCWSYFERD